jgi:hypothetical protein
VSLPLTFCPVLLIGMVVHRENIIMIASEPLTFEQKDWMEVKTNTMVVITPKVSLLSLVPSVDAAAMS